MHRDAELAGGPLDREQLADGVSWRGGGDARALAHAAHAPLGEGQAGAGAPALAAEDPGDLPVGVMLGEATDQLQRVLGEPALFQRPGHLEREAQLGARAALPGSRSARSRTAARSGSASRAPGVKKSPATRASSSGGVGEWESGRVGEWGSGGVGEWETV